MSGRVWWLYTLETPTRWKAGVVVSYRVVDDDFNRANYPELIGQTSGQAPSFAHVEEIRRSFFFDCGDCGAPEPEIWSLLAPAGITADVGPIRFEDIGILSDAEGRRPRPGMFCRACTDRWMAGRVLAAIDGKGAS